MIVIDSASASGAPSDGGDIAPWLKSYVKPWNDDDDGLTVLIVDHVAKQKVDRPPGPIGSTIKGAAVSGASLYVAGQCWSREQDGNRLSCATTRTGTVAYPERLMGEWVAEITGQHADSLLKITIDPYKGREDVVNEDQLYFDLLRAFDETRPDVVRGGRAVRDMVEGTGVAIDRVRQDPD